MPARLRAILASISALFVVLLTIGLVAAFGTTSWQADGVEVCTYTRGQYNPQIVSDGEGGAIIAWWDSREVVSDIYAQRVYSDGTPAWAADGVSLCTAVDYQSYLQLAPDGAGGAVAIWHDYRNTTSSHLYAQRVDADGNTLWYTDGLAICTASGGHDQPQIAFDGVDGAVMTWHDGRGGDADIYAQRVDADGNTLWYTDGVTLCSASYNQWNAQIVSDGDGGAIVAWRDYRGQNTDIYAQRVDSNGDMVWTTNGISLSVSSASQGNPRIVSDGAQGAIVVWSESADGGEDIYAQRVHGDGTTLWTLNGVSLCVASGEQTDPQIVSDGEGGGIVTWMDWRGPDYDIYAQRVYSDGTPAWTADGISVTVASEDQSNPQIAPDGSGGAFVTWTDYRDDDDGDIRAQRLDANGNLLWQAEGVIVCSSPRDQQNPTIVFDGSGSAIVTWEDDRDYSNDIYAQRVGDLIPTDFVYLPLAVKNYQ
jgi:hypothetical protein